MPKSEKVKDIRRKAFAQAYVANEMNGTKAMLAIQPSMTEESAAVAANRLLSEDKTVSAIDTLYASVKDQYMQVMKEALAHAQRLLTHSDERVQLQAHKIIAEYGRLFAPANSTPRSATQINNYTMPKR